MPEHPDRGATLRVETDELPVAMEGTSYTVWLTPYGAQYTWQVTGDDLLPPGLTMTDAGAISGKPKNATIYPFSVTVTRTGGKVSASKRLRLIVSQKLEVTTDLSPLQNQAAPDASFIADMHATGGTPPYVWRPEPGIEWPDELELSEAGRISWREHPVSLGTRKFAVRCTDQNGSGYHATGTFFLRARMPRRWQPWHRRDAGVAMLSTTTTLRPAWNTVLAHGSNYLVALGLALPGLGAVMILMYALAAPGPKLEHIGVAFLVSFTAFLVGVLGGFLLGVPRAVSSGQVRQTAGLRYAPSTNLAEVSDWLTKLLLGAGLVQLTHLGAPIGSLIDTIAKGLTSQPPTPGSISSAQVMAGAILFGYTAVGLLVGYLMTTTWYQSWISRHG